MSVLTKKCNFRGERDGTFLARYLNGEPMYPTPERPSRVGCQRISELVDAFKEAQRALDNDTCPPDEISVVENRLNGLLDHYQQKTLASVTPERVHVEWLTLGQSVSFYESGAFQATIDLARHNLLGKVRKCAHCGRWIFAGRDNRKFCSAACCGSHRDSQPGYGKGRNGYFSDYQTKARAEDVAHKIGECLNQIARGKTLSKARLKRIGEQRDRMRKLLVEAKPHESFFKKVAKQIIRDADTILKRQHRHSTAQPSTRPRNIQR